MNNAEIMTWWHLTLFQMINHTGSGTFLLLTRQIYEAYMHRGSKLYIKILVNNANCFKCYIFCCLSFYILFLVGEGGLETEVSLILSNHWGTGGGLGLLAVPSPPPPPIKSLNIMCVVLFLHVSQSVWLKK